MLSDIDKKKILKYTEIFLYLVIIIDMYNILFSDNIYLFYFSSVFYVLEIIIYIQLQKLEYIKSKKFIFDITMLLTIPFSTIRMLRSIRFLRLLKGIHLLDRDFLKEFNLTCDQHKKTLKSVLFMIVLVFVFSSFFVYYFERDAQPDVFRNVFDGFWWTFTTITTIGFGDLYPVTMAGKMIAIMVSISGLVFLSIPPALITTTLLSENNSRFTTREKLVELDELLSNDLINADEYEKMRLRVIDTHHKK